MKRLYLLTLKTLPSRKEPRIIKKANYIFDTKEYKGLTFDVWYEFEKDKEEITYYEYEGDIYEHKGDVFAELYYDTWVGWSENSFNGNEVSKIIKWIKSESKKRYQEEQKELKKKEEQAKKELEKKLKEKKKPTVKKPTIRPKYTNLYTYKSDLYDALTARGLNSEFAMDYVNDLDNDFMKRHQDIKRLIDEAVREWG